MPTTIAKPSEERLYRQIASQIVTSIENGTLAEGMRAPSVRLFSQQQGVSISTVLSAYRALEDEGYLEARPQSGYYVRERLCSLDEHHYLPEIETTHPPLEPTAINNSELVMRVTQASHQPHFYQLGTAVCCTEFLPTEGLHRALISAIKKYPDEGNHYDFSPGTPRLRQAIARRVLNYGVSLSADDLVLTTGATEAINLCLRAVTKPGDAVVVESPTYYNILQILEALGLRAIEVATHPREGIIIEALEEVLEREKVSAAVLMPTFSNPLGSSMSDENKQRLVALLEKYELPLIEDDVWGDTHFETRPRPAKSWDKNGLVMLVSGFSKTLAPGYRVGWVAPGRWKKRVEYLKLVSSEANATLPSLAIVEFLARGSYDYHLRRVRRIFAEQTQMALEGIARHFPEGTKSNRPTGGHFLWVELPSPVPAIDIFEDALREGVSIAPGPIFSARQKFGNFIRINCGFHSTENTGKALSILGRLVRARM